MKIDVFSLDGNTTRQVELPHVFKEPVRTDLINRAALAVRSAQFQPKGAFKRAGFQTSAEYVGRRRKYRTMINIEMARLPKVKLAKGRFGEVRIVPQARKGHAAHPPKPEKIQLERINKKERLKALRSAVAATAVKALVLKRGHFFEKSVPIIVDDGFESLKKTQDVMSFFSKVGLEKELARASGRTIRAGRGKMRGRRYRKKKSVLVVLGQDKGAEKACRNIPGTDVVLVKNLNVDLLAPGGTPGRLTIFTESALKALK